MTTGGPLCPNCGQLDGHTKECMAGVVYNVIRSLPGYQPDSRPQWNIPLNLEAKPEKHTPERWSAESDGGMNTAEARIVADAARDRRRVMKSSARPDYLALVWTMEDARRIVACVNACADYSTEALRGGLLEIMLSYARRRIGDDLGTAMEKVNDPAFLARLKQH